MLKKKLVFIGGISQKRNIIGGATIKNRYFIQWLTERNIEIELLDTDNWRRNIIYILFKLFYIFFMIKADKIILSTSAKGSYYFLRVANIFNIKKKKIYYFMIGGQTPMKIKSKVFDIKYYKNIEKIYVETQEMNKIMHQLGLTQSSYLPNFKKFKIHERIKTNNVKEIKGIFFARIEKQKGTQFLLDVLKTINKEKIILTVDFYGPVDDEYKLEFFENIKKNEYAYYKGVLDGRKEETFDILGQYDLMLFPTLYSKEGVPGTIIDAFISSLPVVASRWDYAHELITDKTGYLFEIGNKRQFIKIIGEIFENRNILFYKRQNCFRESLKYHIDNVLERIIVELK